MLAESLVVFTGRWPLRTNVQAVVSSTVLANSQVSPSRSPRQSC
jgi:hypothetical protein